MTKLRLDQVITNNPNIIPSPTSIPQVQALILAGKVLVNGKKVTQAGTLVNPDAKIEIKPDPRQGYVGRGAFKLLKAVTEFKLDFTDKIVVDVGASTGGFTQVALGQGARKVYALDVGTNQLAYKLRVDPRVVVMEQTNVKDVSELPEKVDYVLIDVSFISLRQVLPVVKNYLKTTASIIVLFKPQFEADKTTAEKFKGVIKDEQTRQEILTSFKVWCAQNNFTIFQETPSPIQGDKGNVEYLLLIKPQILSD
ncbi:hypothetical protein AUJ78_01630 [Candidatus Peregrinibacteria bacterium CG1_02_41_10]|nr:MAG: hypothetical protein AUJ78_01630 [Candidatus Peregrinibacteria bacterium CG1_02_41_10]